jgi:UDP-2-acetamido-3-amino-2,3-dideoxy-glucuronate N-acetyltransferase
MNYIHETAVLDEGAKIGSGTKIWHFTHIMPKASIGNSVSIGQNCFIGDNVVIGNNVKIQNNVSVYDGVFIEDDVFVGPSVVFTNVKSPNASKPVGKQYTKTIIRKGVTLGANSTIICGVEIGENAFIGAGSVVTKDIPAGTMWYGNPAIEISKI